MTRTDAIQKAHGLSLDDAVKVLNYHQQGAQWIKGLEHDKLQDSMDEFTELLLKTSRDKVQTFTTYVKEKYWAKPEEETDKYLEHVLDYCKKDYQQAFEKRN